MPIDLWKLVHIFPNISMDDFEKYRKNSENFLLYRPEVTKYPYEKYIEFLRIGFHERLLSERCISHESYHIHFSSHEFMNTLVTPFYMDTDEFNHSTWTGENIKKMAHYLSQEPLLLPSFIIQNSLNILSQIMGYSSFEMICGTTDNVKHDDHVFNQYLGLRHLSVFSSCLEELVKEGVNVEALPICSRYKLHNNYEYLFHCRSRQCDNKDLINWEGRLDKFFGKEKEYHFGKPYDFDVPTFFEFQNVTEFLNRVCYYIENYFLVNERDCDWKMPDPKTIDFCTKNYMSDFEETFYEGLKKNLKDSMYINDYDYDYYFVNKNSYDYCSYFESYERERQNKEKGKKVAVVPYLRHLIGLLEKKDRNTTKEISILKKVYQYASKTCVGKEKQRYTVDEIISLLPIIEEMEAKTNYFTEEELMYIKLQKEDCLNMKEETNEEKNSSSQVQKQMTRYEQEIEELKKELEHQKFENRKLEEKIKEYLENGGSIPFDSLSSKEDIEYAKQVLAKKTCSSFLEKARKVAFSMLLYGVSGTALLNFIDKKIKEIYPEVSFQIDEEGIFSHENIVGEEHSLVDLLQNKDLFLSQKPILKEKEKEDKKLFSFENYDINHAIPYYTTVYDSEPVGYTETAGLIISYYALEQTGTQLVKIATCKTQEELDSFLMVNKDRNLIWKAGYYIGNEVDLLKAMINSGKEIPYTYISFFIDYNVQKELEEEKIIIKK